MPHNGIKNIICSLISCPKCSLHVYSEQMSTFHFVSKEAGSNYPWRYRKRLIPDAYQEKISTVWAVCERQCLNLTCFVVVFLIKLTFSWKKGCIFSTKAFYVPRQYFYWESFFRLRRKQFWSDTGKKRPQVSSEQNICPSWVKRRFRSLFCLTWFSSLPDECLDHTSEKRVGRCLFLLLFWERSTKLSLLFPS